MTLENVSLGKNQIMLFTKLCIYCEKKHYAKGLCVNHYARLGRTGHALGIERFTRAELFWRHVNTLGEHHLWTGATYDNGYGVVNWYGTNIGVHRVAWFLYYDSWPTLQVLHHCDIRICVKKKCLFEGTQLDNMQDMVSKGRNRNQHSA